MQVNLAASNITHNNINNNMSNISTVSNNIYTQIGDRQYLGVDGFAGISYDGLNDLKANLQKYVEDIQREINGFGLNPADIDAISGAFKGNIKLAAEDFISEIKKLLQAYVSNLKQEIAEIDDYREQYTVASSTVFNDVKKDADFIRNTAPKFDD